MARNESGIKTILIVAAGVLIFALSGGIRANYGIIIKPISQSSGIDYASVSFVFGISQLAYGVTQSLWGVLALKRSNIFVLLTGIPLMEAGLLLTAVTHSMAVLFVAFGLMIGSGAGALCFGIIMGAISPMIGSEYAATASGILNAGSGIGGAALSPLIQAMISSFGIQAALLSLAGPFLILVPVVLWIGRLGIKGTGELTDHQTNEEVSGQSEDEGISTLSIFRKALQSPDYRRLMIGFSTCGFHMIIVQTHMVPQFISMGFSETLTAAVYTAYGIFTMMGSIASGILCSRFPMKNVLGSLYGARAVSVLVFMIFAPKNTISILVFSFMMGVTGDATVTPTSGIISRQFGVRAMGFLFGITFVCHQIGAFISSWLGGILIGRYGSYLTIWILDIFLCVLAAIVSYCIRKTVYNF